MKILKSNLARVEKQIRGRESEREREWKWNLYLTHIWWLITFILCMRKMECVFSLKEENVLGGSSKSVSSSFIRNRSMKIYFEMSDYIFKFKGMSRGFLARFWWRGQILSIDVEQRLFPYNTDVIVYYFSASNYENLYSTFIKHTNNVKK